MNGSAMLSSGAERKAVMILAFQQTNRGKITLIAYIVLVWFALALSASILGIFFPTSRTVPALFGLAVGVPIIAFAAGYLLSSAFRRFMGSIVGDPWAITALQTYRVIGIVFVVLVSRNALPALFGLPAGWGDTLVGGTAAAVALAWSSRSRSGKALFVLWNILGMLDLLTALTLGALTPFIQPHGISTASLTIFPLSLIPTFGVPISFILHITGLGQFWQERQQAKMVRAA